MRCLQAAGPFFSTTLQLNIEIFRDMRARRPARVLLYNALHCSEVAISASSPFFRRCREGSSWRAPAHERRRRRPPPGLSWQTEGIRLRSTLSVFYCCARRRQRRVARRAEGAGTWESCCVGAAGSAARRRGWRVARCAVCGGRASSVPRAVRGRGVGLSGLELGCCLVSGYDVVMRRVTTGGTSVLGMFTLCASACLETNALRPTRLGHNNIFSLGLFELCRTGEQTHSTHDITFTHLCTSFSAAASD